MVTGSGSSEEATFLTPSIDRYMHYGLFITQNRRRGGGACGVGTLGLLQLSFISNRT